MFDATPTAIAAPLVATTALLGMLWALRQPRSRRLLGPAADGWEFLRRLVLPLLDRLARRQFDGGHYASYELPQGELVGVIDAPPERVERMLWERGAKRMPLAALKTLPDGRTEVGSWTFRETLLATHQTHVILFHAEGGRTLVAAHQEFSALNPATALRHYRGAYYSPQDGEEFLRRKLDSSVWLES